MTDEERDGKRNRRCVHRSINSIPGKESNDVQAAAIGAGNEQEEQRRHDQQEKQKPIFAKKEQREHIAEFWIR
ncbi:hypothetical protein INT45_008387 [Circinella minor]|uniref:Uncharacterized protein n=1 Tax=Circinella minor TaxID=1195481 RepID=A0A8H7VJN4_9FUNG|nr:hypothetical protein INT45_008387 [Circinella minor]